MNDLTDAAAQALASTGQCLLDRKDPELLDEAESRLRRALVLEPGSSFVLEQLGRVLGAQGRLNEAFAFFRQALAQAPRDVSVQLSLAELLLGCGRFDDGASMLKDVESLNPTNARLQLHLGTLAIRRGRFAEAAEAFRAALTIDAALAEARSGLGSALEALGQFEQAETCFREAIEADPNLIAPLIALAKLQADRGEFEASCQSARSALAVCPNSAEAYWRLAMNLKGALPEHDIRAIERLREHRYVPHGLRAGLGFALGAVFDARGQYTQAAQQFEAANALKAAVKSAKGQSFNPGEYSASIDRIIATFSSELLARGRAWGNPDPRPVFVVGLPRSGTTLVEQILASHSQVHGAGELRDVLNLFNALPTLIGRPELDSFDALHILGPESTRSIAGRYIATLDRLAPSTAQRIVDKMPDNFLLIGFIAILWPSTKLIICSRDPRDVALSCWQTPFGTIPWSTQWDHIASRFADHARLLAHWQSTKPIPWLDVQYEELVQNLEQTSRRLIDFLGLEWEPACLKFHKTRRIVRTASHLQVREPIHTRSIGRWKKYEPTIQPLFDAFERFGVASKGATRQNVVDADSPPQER